jgi:hypothetical protein
MESDDGRIGRNVRSLRGSRGSSERKARADEC